MTTDVFDIRLANLKSLIVQWGGPTSLAKKLELSGPSFLSQMVGGIRPLTEKTARKVEQKLGLAPGWMDQDHDTPGNTLRAAAIDDSLITKTVSLVGAKLQESNLQLRPDKFAELVSLAYGEACRSGGTLDENFVERLVQLMR